MTLYAHVTGSTVDSVGQPPALVYEAGRWWDLRPMTPAVLAPRGWFVVTPTARPADTDTTTTDYSVTLVGGVPTETWTTRPWTTDELAARARQAVAATLTAQLKAGIAAIRAARDQATTDQATATGLRTQADTLSAAVTTQRTALVSWVPTSTGAARTDLQKLRDDVTAALARQKQIIDAISAFYGYRLAVDQNAVTTDNALLWLAKQVSGDVLAPEA